MAFAADEQTPRSFVDPYNDLPPPDQEEFDAHVRTYQSFVRGTIVFVAHVAVILALLAYFLA